MPFSVLAEFFCGFAVLDDFFSSVLRFVIYPNAPLFQLTLKLTLPFLGGKRLPKLFVTMVIRNVTLNDDSTYGALGRYGCHAFAVGDPLERRHGFSVIVIRSKSFTWLSSRSVLAA